MTGKEYLERLRRMRRTVNLLQENYNILKGDIYSLKAIDYSKTRVSGSHASDSMADLIAVLDEQKKELTKEWAGYIKLRAEATRYISLVSNQNYRLMLMMRYVNNKSWYAISKCIGYERTQTYRIHKEAINDFEEKFNEITKMEQNGTSKCDIV